MMKIIADSSANISALEGVCFQSIPMTIRAGEREFVDDGTLDTAKMLDYLASYNGKSGTACPGLDAWLQAFSGVDEIFVVTITGFSRSRARPLSPVPPGGKNPCFRLAEYGA